MLMSTRIEVHQGIVNILFDGQKTRLTANRVEAFAKVVEAARLLADGVGSEPVARSTARPSPERKAATPKRRSRKRVSLALAAWMQSHPGWHSEEALLETVIAHEMTDASPKRALKIALGRQRNKVFADNGAGYWRLVTDTSAGKAPRARRKAKNGRKKAAKKGAASDSDRGDGGGQAEVTEPGARVIRVRKGEDRKLAPLSEEARRKRVEADAGPTDRWGRVSRDQVERATQNLLGHPGLGALADGWPG